MTQFKWTIANREYTNDDSKGVVVAHYRVDGVDGEYSMGAYGTQSFTPDPEAEGYVAFEALTEADVIAWVQNAVDKDTVESAIQAKIDEQKNPATVSGLPWAND